MSKQSMKGILEKTFKGWVVNAWAGEGEEFSFIKSYPLHETDSNQLDEIDAGFFGVHGDVEFELVMGYDSVFKTTQPFAKIWYPMLDKLRTHLDSITPEQLAQEFDEIQEWFQSEMGDEDDGLTPDELIIKDLHHEKQQRAIDFAKWLAKEWMSMWVVDKWLWENVSVDTNDQTKWKGYFTEEQLYELYLKSE